MTAQMIVHAKKHFEARIGRTSGTGYTVTAILTKRGRFEERSSKTLSNGVTVYAETVYPFPFVTDIEMAETYSVPYMFVALKSEPDSTMPPGNPDLPEGAVGWSAIPETADAWWWYVEFDDEDKAEEYASSKETFK